MELVNHTVINLIIFVLAIYVGYHVVWNVTAALHTPLMAVTNAISTGSPPPAVRRRIAPTSLAARPRAQLADARPTSSQRERWLCRSSRSGRRADRSRAFTRHAGFRQCAAQGAVDRIVDGGTNRQCRRKN